MIGLFTRGPLLWPTTVLAAFSTAAGIVWLATATAGLAAVGWTARTTNQGRNG